MGNKPALAALVWLGVLAFVFVLFVGEWTAVDWVAAGAAGAVAAVVGAALARLGLLRFRPRARWLALLPAVGRQIFVDFAIISVELVRCVRAGRRERGVFVARAVPAGGDDPEGAAWRAFLTVAATWSPNCYVIDVDRRHQRRLAHDLVAHRASESPA